MTSAGKKKGLRILAIGLRLRRTGAHHACSWKRPKAYEPNFPSLPLLVIIIEYDERKLG